MKKNYLQKNFQIMITIFGSKDYNHLKNLENLGYKILEQTVRKN